MSGRLLHRFIDDVEVKRCARCHQWLPLDVFSSDRHHWDALSRPCRKCDAEASKRYHAKNKERVLAQRAKYRAENPEKKHEEYVRYCAKHPKKVREKDVRDPAEKREKVRAQHARWRVENPEKERARNARYYARHPEMKYAAWARRRARKQRAEGYEYTTSVHIQARRELYGNRCYICGAQAEAMDHVIPLVKGGSHWPANLRPICAHCNATKGAKWPYAPALAAMFV